MLMNLTPDVKVPDCHFRLILREKELHMNIGVYNPNKDVPFNFNLLLHTYFKCPDVRRCQVIQQDMSFNFVNILSSLH